MDYWFLFVLYGLLVFWKCIRRDCDGSQPDSYESLRAYQQYFKISIPIYYFVPLTQLTVFVIWFLNFRTADGKRKHLLKKASIFDLLSILITAVIVTWINIKYSQQTLKSTGISYSFSL